MWDVFANQSENFDSCLTHALLSLIQSIKKDCLEFAGLPASFIYQNALPAQRSAPIPGTKF